jgi:hypothetical protein
MLLNILDRVNFIISIASYSEIDACLRQICAKSTPYLSHLQENPNVFLARADAIEPNLQQLAQAADQQ